MFDLYGLERLTEWKKFRDSLETSETPLKDLAEFWSRAPFVSPFLDPNNPSKWPDPWHLILDDRLDDLAIVLGMLYTLKLTNRFMGTPCEIHKSMFDNESDPKFVLVVDHAFLLNYHSREVIDFNTAGLKTSLVWSN